ncbi:MAG: hypothetical protein JO327_02230 [Nitrososphaeraceae archaeon]|nr:hypothetical protein [Nitrososphaeraceae archaeon]MBV9666929.1 hypothetical protein [Nitrososphaeraceae archaeon]
MVNASSANHIELPLEPSDKLKQEENISDSKIPPVPLNSHGIVYSKQEHCISSYVQYKCAPIQQYSLSSLGTIFYCSILLQIHFYPIRTDMIMSIKLEQYPNINNKKKKVTISS